MSQSPEPDAETNRTGISIISMHDSTDVLEYNRSYFESFNSFPYFELSYQMDESFIRNVPEIAGQVVSAHAPCPGGSYLPTFGSQDNAVIADSHEILRRTGETVKSFGGDIIVFHAGYTLDSPIHTEYSLRKKVLKEYSLRSKDAYSEGSAICRPGYYSTDEYKAHLDITIRNLKHAFRICADRGIRLAVENLNPRLTYLFQVPDDFAALLDAIPEIGICLDIGHLYISSLVHDFNYFEAMQQLLSTGRVLTTHIHDNNSTRAKEPVFKDEHRTLGTGKIPIEESLSIIRKLSTANIIIESVEEPFKNAILLSRILT